MDGRERGSIASPAGPVVGLAAGRGWLVVEKPCGLSIHNAPGSDLCSVVLAALKQGWLPAAGDARSRVHAVHRLDRDTSGVVLLALDPQTLAWFGGQFAARTVHKRYLAMIHGRLDGSTAGATWCVWDQPLTASAAGRKDPMGRGSRLPCATRWRMLDQGRRYTLIECEPLTGRKHQIRRHAKLAGHPVVGDRRYGSSRSRDYLVRHHRFDRLGLHAHSLGIRLRGESQNTVFRSAGLPPAMAQLLTFDRCTMGSRCSDGGSE
ncbi:MAG TPA: RNA pseudouridine synthase [Desulfosarcina sp.]|nr:RNA pseudouridine synthase [Desulfosarcina sp.]